LGRGEKKKRETFNEREIFFIECLIFFNGVFEKIIFNNQYSTLNVQVPD
jgi:hypothetical protein